MLPADGTVVEKASHASNGRVARGGMSFVSLLACLTLSAGLTAFTLGASFHHGKLCVHPFYDDVAYFEDGLMYIRAFHLRGVAGLIGRYVCHPPHSPFSSALAAGAFTMLGRHDWAPYLADALIVLAILLFIDHLADARRWFERVLILLACAATPVFVNVIDAFRPDFASGACAAAGCIELLRPGSAADGWRRRGWAGVCFGSAMVFKPPTFPLTLLMMFAAVGASLIVGYFTAPRRSWGRRVGENALVVACALAVALPHFLIAWKQTWTYIRAEVYGSDYDVWARPGSFWWHLRYYLDGEGGRLMLGRHLLLLAAVVVGVVLFQLRSRRVADLWHSLGMVVLILLAWAVPTALASKQEFYGATFYFMLIFAAVSMLVTALPTTGAAGPGVLVMLSTLSLICLRGPPIVYLHNSPSIAARKRVVNRLLGAIRSNHLERRAGYITTSGYVNRAVLNYLSLKHDLVPLLIREQPFCADPAQHARAIDQADYVIASERGNSEAFESFVRSGAIQDQTLALVASRPDFQLLFHVSTQNEHGYFLFCRKNLRTPPRELKGVLDDFQ